MKIIAITQPQVELVNHQKIERLFDEGLYRLHLRFPSADEQAYRRVIERISEQFYPQISLNDYHFLAAEYGLGGIHLNSRNPQLLQGWRGLVSQSCHSLDEVKNCTADYHFLSPIFDSISKQGYESAFTIEQLQEAINQGIITEKTVALGGVNYDNMKLLEQIGFSMVAMLGAIW